KNARYTDTIRANGFRTMVNISVPSGFQFSVSRQQSATALICFGVMVSVSRLGNLFCRIALHAAVLAALGILTYPIFPSDDLRCLLTRRMLRLMNATSAISVLRKGIFIK